AEPAGLARDALPELGEDLGLAPGRRDLVVEIADLLERPLLVERLLGERDAGRGEIPVHDLVDQAALERLVGADRIAAHDHLQRLLRTDHAWQPLRAARTGEDAQLHLGQAEAGALHTNAIVTGQGDLEPSAERRPVD